MPAKPPNALLGQPHFFQFAQRQHDMGCAFIQRRSVSDRNQQHDAQYPEEIQLKFLGPESEVQPPGILEIEQRDRIEEVKRLFYRALEFA
jgi:hypothetical protein